MLHIERLLLIILLCLFSYSCNNKKEAENVLSATDTTLKDGILSNYEVNLFNQFLSDAKTLEPDITLKNDLLQDVLLSDIINEPTLVFRFSELHCEICIDQEVKKLNEYFPKLKNRAIILTTYNNTRDFNIFRRLNQVKMPVYKLEKNLNLDIEEAYIPYLFVLDSNLKIHHLFVPDKLFPNVSNSFYEGFITRYLQ